VIWHADIYRLSWLPQSCRTNDMSVEAAYLRVCKSKENDSLRIVIMAWIVRQVGRGDIRPYARCLACSFVNVLHQNDKRLPYPHPGDSKPLLGPRFGPL
jgi:hypothetical protein